MLVPVYGEIFKIFKKICAKRAKLMDRTVCVYKPNFHLARHVSTQHDTTRSTCRAHAFWPCRACRTARLDTLDTTSATGATRNLVCFVICIGYDNVSYSLIYWSIHLFNLFHLKEQIGFVYVRAQTTKLVQASTIASSRPPCRNKHGSTRSTRGTCRDVTSQVEFGPQ